MAIDHKLIDTIVGNAEEQSDTSLRGHAMRRALDHAVPKTLTPHEWEQWYAENGVPKGHTAEKTKTKTSWWRFWRA